VPQGPEEPVETIFETLKDSFREDREAVESLTGIERIREAFRTARSELEESPLPRRLPLLPGFRILEKVGEGSFGTVYQAIDEKLGREVALKVLSGDLFGQDSSRREGRRNFLHEARALASIDHPNVLKIHSILECDGEVVLVTEFLEGRSLDQLLEEAGPMGPGEAAHVGMEIARALAAVHAAGLVHRDVKSANILRKLGGRFVLTDFGEGLFYGRDGEPETIGAVAGTPLFMSPEQVKGQNVDPRSDIYSLGVVLYHLSTGELPYPLSEDTKVGDLFQWITSGQKVSVRDRRPDLPEPLVQTIEQALATSPEDRFQTAGELEGALLECVGRGRKRRPLSRPLAWGLAGLIPVAAIVIWWLTVSLSAIPFQAQFWFIGDGDEPTPLEDGSSLDSGDRIYLDLECRVPVNLYILCGDSRGNRVFLFPRQESQLANPVPAGRQRLPSVPGEAWKASVFSGNRTVFYIIGAEQPFLPLERALPSQIRFSPNAGPMESAPINSDPAVKSALLDDVIADLDEQEEGSEFAADAWYLRFEFEVIPEAESDGEEDSN
jgi:serine/threonine protein kinase